MSNVETARGRGTIWCRGCGGTGLTSLLDLGEQPLANELSASADAVDPVFPLHLFICPTCGLGQLGEFVKPERLFADDYPYFSSVSTSWVEHAERYAEQMVAELDLRPGDFVLEVASNDGYLLQHFRELGLRVLGIEPALDVANAARAKGIETVTAFFGADTAAEILAEHGHPRLVVANNVMAHVPDLADFARGFAILADAGTLITVENPTFINLLTETQFDTIYHEHFSYLTAHAVRRCVQRVGLELVGVEAVATHGGSNRYRLAAAGAMTVDPGAIAAADSELERGLLDPQVWAEFAERSRAAVDGLRTWLNDRRTTGRRVAGYGAAAKGNTLLNAAGVTPNDIELVVDGSLHKQGKFLPGSRIPVLAPSDLPDDIDDILVLPWNIAGELVPLVEQSTKDATPWAAIPMMRELT